MAIETPRERGDELMATATALVAQSRQGVNPAKRAHWLLPTVITLGVATIGFGVTRLNDRSRDLEGSVKVVDQPGVEVTTSAPVPPTTPVVSSPVAPVEVAVSTPTTIAAEVATTMVEMPTTVMAAMNDAAPATDPAVAGEVVVASEAVVPADRLALAPADPGPVVPFTFELEPDGKAYIRGSIPSEQMAAEVQAAGAGLLGPENIVNESSLNPAATMMLDHDAAHGYVTKTLHYPLGIAGLQPDHRAALDQVAALLLARPDVVAHVQAYTDDLGSDDQNFALSDARARRVVEYLTSLGVPEAQIGSMVGNGEADPVGDNLTEEGRALNRRVAIHLTIAA